MQISLFTHLQWALLGATIAPLIIFIWYYLYYFTSLFKKHSKKKEAVEKGISVLVCAKNEEENLKQLLPVLLNQNYKNFEVVIINDGSWDGSHQYLQEMAADNGKVVNIYLDPEKKIQSGKKLAITLGIKAAKNDLILFTDADCLPKNENWISSMACNAQENKVVLGYSPYIKKKGLLNWFIRLETQLTAFLYLGAAGRGFSYMCVGRNLLYSKESFYSTKGFSAHHHIGAGDDDLQLQNFAKHKIKPLTVVAKDSFVSSKPKESWQEWVNQKRRHTQIGKYYGFKQKLYAGLFSLVHYWFWFALLFLAILEPNLWPITLGILGFKILFTWLMSVFLARKLDDMSTMYLQPLNEFLMMFYWLIMGVYVFFTKKKGW